MAGTNKLMNHIPNVVPIIPATFPLYNFNSSTPNFPLIPKSAIAKDGTMANTKNKTLTIQKLCHQPTPTCVNCNIKMYCKTKTKYLSNERKSNLNKRLASNSSHTLMSLENFSA